MLKVVVEIIIIIIPVISTKTDHLPRQIHTSTDVLVTQGQTAVLPCTTSEDDHEKYMIIWMNPKKILISQKNSRFIDDTRMSIERPFLGDWNLHVQHVQYKDRGVYTCTVNSYPVVVRHVNLTVQVPSKIIDSSSTSSVRVREGETVKLVCNATGIPQPKITWYRQSFKHDNVNEKVGDVGEELIIRNISRYCGGTYLCQAYNDVPPAVSRPIKVEVQFKPEVVLRNERIGQSVGKETILECIITASPQGDYYWKRGSEKIIRNRDWRYRTEIYTEKPYTVYLRLHIVNLDVRDYGRYTCVAKNIFGTRQDTMLLYEYNDPTTTTTTTTVKTTTLSIPATTIDYHQRSTHSLSKVVHTDKDVLLVSDGQVINKNKIYGMEKPKKSSQPKQESIKTGHIGTGSVNIDKACSGKSSPVVLLIITFFVTLLFWTRN